VHVRKGLERVVLHVLLVYSACGTEIELLQPLDSEMPANDENAYERLN